PIAPSGWAPNGSRESPWGSARVCTAVPGGRGRAWGAASRWKGCSAGGSGSRSTKPASAGCRWPTSPATRTCRSAPFADPLPDGLRVGRYRGEVGREAQERLARLAEDRLELGVLDLQEREAAGSLGVGLGPVDGREDAV